MWRFSTAIAIGRGARFFIIAVLAAWYGRQVLDWITQHGRGIGLTLAALVAAAALGWYWWSRRRAALTRRLAKPLQSLGLSAAEDGALRSRQDDRSFMILDLSIVIPVRNESANIDLLCRELVETLEASGRSFEVILIDDGSTDDSFAKLAAGRRRTAALRIIRFRRNFGQTAAFAAGFAYARGSCIVTSDGDLQNDPA